MFPNPLPISTKTEGAERSRVNRARGVKRAPADFLYHHTDPYWYETDAQKASVKPEDKSFRLWGRLNPNYGESKLRTEYQRQYLDGPPSEPVEDRSYFMRVQNKAYLEARAKDANTKKEIAKRMGAAGGTGTLGGPPQSPSKG